MGIRSTEALLTLLDEAFEGREIEESTENRALTSLKTVTDQAWRILPDDRWRWQQLEATSG